MPDITAAPICPICRHPIAPLDVVTISAPAAVLPFLRLGGLDGEIATICRTCGQGLQDVAEVGIRAYNAVKFLKGAIRR